jgi:hypothetical protein
MFLTNIKYSTLSSEHNREDLYIQLINQQTCTSNKHNFIRGGMIFNLNVVDVLLLIC